MHVMRFADAHPIEVAEHFGMVALPLDGIENAAGRMRYAVSHYLPGGGACQAVSPCERLYFMLAGELTVLTDSGEVTLGVHDNCWIAPGEMRAIENRTSAPATMLVVFA